MTTIKGPVKVTKENIGEFIKKAEEAGAKINLPFTATKFKSTKKIVPIEETPKEKTIEPKKTVKDKMLDNYLDQNARTVIKALQEDNFDDDTLADLLELEKTDKDRKTVKEAIEAMIGD